MSFFLTWTVEYFGLWKIGIVLTRLYVAERYSTMANSQYVDLLNA